MYTFAFYGHFCTGSIEIFVFQFAYLTAVHGVSPIGAKFFYIKLMGTTAYFFIRSKAHFYSAVFYFRMLNKILHSRNYFTNTGFVIGTQKRRAICGNKCLSFVKQQIFKVIRRQDNIFSFI